jgi:hypothetical protein
MAAASCRRVALLTFLHVTLPVANAFSCSAPASAFSRTSALPARYANRRFHSRFSLNLSANNNPFNVLREAEVIDPNSGSKASILAGVEGKRVLVVLAPQLGDFDSAEYAEQLAAVVGELDEAGISLRFVGIGETGAAKRFAQFNSLPLECIRVDPNGAIHASLGLHAGPDWNVPEWLANLLPSDAAVQARARAWLNYMAMCAGLGSRGTIREILRGYLGDKSAPERLAPNSIVKVGPIEITSTRRVKLGPIEYDQMWKEERGYQRPIELATVRLRVMVEVLSNWREYVT